MVEKTRHSGPVHGQLKKTKLNQHSLIFCDFIWGFLYKIGKCVKIMKNVKKNTFCFGPKSKN